MDKVMEKWNEILQMVKEEHGLTDVSFNTWIKPLEVFAIDGNTLYILVPSEQMGLSYINKKYYLLHFFNRDRFFRRSHDRLDFLSGQSRFQLLAFFLHQFDG